MKIGLMGGTFNPIHIAHLRIAEEARELCGLDRLLFIPSGDPPHKQLAGNVPFAVRCEMVRLAISSNPFFHLSEIEGQRSGKSYSVDTIDQLRREHPDDELYFIIGSDSFLDMALWHRPEEIFRGCNLIVIQRPGSPVGDPTSGLPVEVRQLCTYSSQERRLIHPAGTSVWFMTGCPLEISSSAIRGLIKARRSIRYLVPPEVEAYIKEQRIYSECR